MDMDLNQLMGIMQQDDGLQQMMLKPAFQNEAGFEFSQAELIADVVNILRMDTKRIAEAAGVDVEVEKMTPERAASLLQGIAEGSDLGLVDVFDNVEDQRMKILAELEDDEAVEDFLELKQDLLYTVPDDMETEA